jgi:mRNA interferase YafQ
MKTPIYTNRFAKDLKLMTKRGRDPENIKTVIRNLIEKRPLDRKFRDHVLIGNFKERRECHVEPDWLLIYRIEESAIIFERTGIHTDLFR